MGAEEFPQYDKHVFMLYKYNENTEFKRLEEKLKNKKEWVISYDPDAIHVMHVFEIPEENMLGLEKFRLGRYSEIPERLKKKIMKFHDVNINLHPLHPIYGILYRMEFQYKAVEKQYDIIIPRDQEVSSLPDFTREIYLNDYKIKSKQISKI
jgi:hypothetical protein